MIVKTFDMRGMAHTLESKEVDSTGEKYMGMSMCEHNDGWTIAGYVHEDMVTWVNDFMAWSLKYGRVWGNFEKIVYADSEEAYQHFIENHPPREWDYQDI